MKSLLAKNPTPPASAPRFAKSSAISRNTLVYEAQAILASCTNEIVKRIMHHNRARKKWKSLKTEVGIGLLGRLQKRWEASAALSHRLLGRTLI